MPWQWTKVEKGAFESLKELISTRCMGYFRVDWETELITDASPVGLGAVLCQYNPKNPEERHIVCFLSRLLTDVERRYSQAEKEALGVVWACEKAEVYVFDHPFRIVVVDNRAVQLINGNAKSKPPAQSAPPGTSQAATTSRTPPRARGRLPLPRSPRRLS